MGTRLSLRPDLDQDVGLLALYVSGNLPNAKPGLAYEGRLKIHNAEGACTAEQIGGDTLPPGSSVFVDNATQQVVVAWPAYAEFVTPLQNPSFESGDLSGWTLTPKGGTATATADTSQKFDGAYSLRWPGGKGLGSEGGIEVEAWNNTIGPCLPGQRVTSHARCMYNPGGHNFGSRYQGLLRFLDGAGMPIGPAVRGRQFKGRGENGRWNDASATGVGPVGTKGVQMGAWLTGSNAPVWLDAASWDVPSSAGINIETTLCITLRVRDSAGRTALWSGCMNIITQAPSKWVVLVNRNMWIAEDSDSFASAAHYVNGGTGSNYNQVETNDIVAVINAGNTNNLTYSDMPDWDVKGVAAVSVGKFALAGKYIIGGYGNTNVKVNTDDGSIVSLPMNGGGSVFGDSAVLVQYNAGNNAHYTYSYSFDSGTSWILNGPTSIGFPTSLVGVGNMGVTTAGGTAGGVFRCQFLGVRNSGVDEIISYATPAAAVGMAYSQDGWMVVFNDNTVVTRIWNRSSGFVAKAAVPTSGVVKSIAADDRHFIAATDLGEMWRSGDFGGSWQLIDSGVVVGSIDAIRVWGSRPRSQEEFPAPGPGVEVYNRNFTDGSVSGLTGFGPSVSFGSSSSGLTISGTVSNNAVRVRLDDSPMISDFEAEYDVDAPVSGVNGGLIYRNGQWLDANDTYGYLVALGSSSVVLGRGTAGGAYTALATGAVSAVPAGTPRHVRVLVEVQRHRVWVDGVLAIDHTNASYVNVSSKLGFNRFKDTTPAGSMTFRNLIVRSA